MYDILARYYDQLHASLTADIPFVLRQAQIEGDPVLELGCGTGRILLPLAQAGVSVTGIDNSPQMLKIARRRLAELPPAKRENVTLVEKDLLDLAPGAFPVGFSLALFSYNTLFHFHEAQVGRLVRTVSSLLRSSGKLLIDVANPIQIAAMDYPEVPVFEAGFVDSESGDHVEQWSLSSLDTSSQTLAVSWLFRTENVVSTVQEVEIAYHYLYPHQLILLLQQAGVSVENIWGSYHQEPFTDESERLIILAKKVEQLPL